MQEKTVICVVFLSEIDTKEIVFLRRIITIDCYTETVKRR